MFFMVTSGKLEKGNFGIFRDPLQIHQSFIHQLFVVPEER